MHTVTVSLSFAVSPAKASSVLESWRVRKEAHKLDMRDRRAGRKGAMKKKTNGGAESVEA